jgi:hypothetical protein
MNLSLRKGFGDNFAIFRPKGIANLGGLALLESRKVQGEIFSFKGNSPVEKEKLPSQFCRRKAVGKVFYFGIWLIEEKCFVLVSMLSCRGPPCHLSCRGGG